MQHYTVRVNLPPAHSQLLLAGCIQIDIKRVHFLRSRIRNKNAADQLDSF